MFDIRELKLAEMEDFFNKLDEKRFRAGQVYDWLWKKHVTGFDQMTNIPLPLRNHLAHNFYFRALQIETIQVSSDGTRKFAFKTSDNFIVEGVLIPSDYRTTACISSQAGCALKCLFCATGKIKFRRDLTAGEMFDQVVEIEKIAKEINSKKLSNIVLMGMGEPLLNYENVLNAIERISSDNGLGYSASRITISTAGIAKMIRKLADDKIKCNLAVSLHTADNFKRDQIMPLNKSNPLDELAGAIKYFYQKTGKRITYEYLLMKDFNDTHKDARQFAEFCKISPCKINLIEYNEVRGSPFKRSDPERTRCFKEFLESRNLVINLRKSRGADIDAACGQLAGKQVAPH
jgi:23S rRNA (adenine2503-C2)-methyltransferase